MSLIPYHAKLLHYLLFAVDIDIARFFPDKVSLKIYEFMADVGAKVAQSQRSSP